MIRRTTAQSPLKRSASGQSRKVPPAAGSSSAAGAPQWRTMMKRRIEPWLLVSPAMILLALIFVYPLLFNLQLSFEDRTLLTLLRPGEWVGLDNYEQVLAQPVLWQSFFNTAFWQTIVSVTLMLIIGFFIAVGLNARAVRLSRLSGLGQTLMLLPWVTPPVVAVAAWRWLLHPEYGLVNQGLIASGALNNGISFTTNTSIVWPTIVVIIVWSTMPLIALMLLAGLQGIPESVYDAARLDGAGVFRTTWSITLPLLRPVLAIVGLMATIWTFNNFTYVWLATRGGPGDFTQVLGTFLYTEAFRNFRVGTAAAVGVLMSLVMLAFALIYFRIVVRRSVEES